MSESFSIEEAREKLDQFQAQLEQLVPNPSGYRLLDIGKEYIPTELRDLLQCYGSYLANLHALEGRIEAEALIVDRGLKTGLSVAVGQSDSKATTITAKEAEVFASNPAFRDLKKLQIYNDSYLALIKGWREAYSSAYATVSRLISLLLGEYEHLSPRSN